MPEGASPDGGNELASFLQPSAPQEQIYNLATDLAQKTNLAATQPERVTAMRTRLTEIARTATNKGFGAGE